VRNSQAQLRTANGRFDLDGAAMRTEDSDVTRHLLSNPVNAAALLRAIADLNAGLGFKHDPRHAPLGSPEGR
jgi:hypothetical protein